jgi:serine/threonine protein kinase
MCRLQMKPTPEGLKESLMIPILREVAIAVQAVHEAGLIHRDIKCANVLITEEGAVQLCDFGVAGITESMIDKRSTFVGTPNWMAPELWEGKYGKEVDIWAWGSFAYEMATGAPPNAATGLRPSALGSYLKTHTPRLEGDQYSQGLKSILACCLVDDPAARYTGAQLQTHPYLANTEESHPTRSLVELIKAFKKWEEVGGTRKSLFMPLGAAGPADHNNQIPASVDWNFSTTDTFDQAVDGSIEKQDIINVYGSKVNLASEWMENIPQQAVQKREHGGSRRRRPPPETLAPLKAPIEKVFDPNTISSYHQNSKSQYGGQSLPTAELPAQPKSDLALRDDTIQPGTRESVLLLDMGSHDAETGLSTFSDENNTIKPVIRDPENGSFFENSTDSNHKPSASDPAEKINRRATKDWKFPMMQTSESATQAEFRFPPLAHPSATPGSSSRPTLHHHPTEPTVLPTQISTGHSLAPPSPNGADRMSLIDLDLSIPDVELRRPSTAGSSAAEPPHPFQWGFHSSMQQHSAAERIPSLFIPDDQPQIGLRQILDASDLSASDTDNHDDYYSDAHETETVRSSRDDRPPPPRREASEQPTTPRPHSPHPRAFPPLTAPPSYAAMTGTASTQDVKGELRRLVGGFAEQLEAFKAAYEKLPAKGRAINRGDGKPGLGVRHVK